MQISLKELLGLFIGALLGALPFLAIWFSSSRTPYDTTGMLFGAPAIYWAPFGVVLGAIAGVASIRRK
jgi:hypothetical protein